MAGASSYYYDKKTGEATVTGGTNTTTTSSGAGYDGVIMETARELLKSWSGADFGDSVEQASSAAAAALRLTTQTGEQRPQTPTSQRSDNNDDGCCSSGDGDDSPITRFRKDPSMDVEDGGSSAAPLVPGLHGDDSYSDDDEDSCFRFCDEGDSSSSCDGQASSQEEGDNSDGDKSPYSSVASKPQAAGGETVVDEEEDGESAAANKNNGKQQRYYRRRNRPPILRPSSFNEGIEIISRKRPLNHRKSSRRRSESSSSLQAKDDSNVTFVSDPTPTTISRLSDERIQQILVAAMRYQTEHAATLPSPTPSQHHQHQHHHRSSLPPTSSPSQSSACTTHTAGVAAVVTITSPKLVPRPCLSPGTPPPTLTIASVPPAAPPQLMLPELRQNNNHPPRRVLSRDYRANSGITELRSELRSSQDVHVDGDSHVDHSHHHEDDDDLDTTDALMMAEQALRHAEEGEKGEQRAGASLTKTTSPTPERPRPGKACSFSSNSSSHNSGPPLSDISIEIESWEDSRQRLDTIHSMGSATEGESTSPDVRRHEQQRQEVENQQSQAVLEQDDDHEPPQQQGSHEWTTVSDSSISDLVVDDDEDDIQLLPLPSEEDTLLTALMETSDDPVDEARRDMNDNTSSDQQHGDSMDDDDPRVVPSSSSHERPNKIQSPNDDTNLDNSLGVVREDEKKEANPADGRSESLRSKQKGRASEEPGRKAEDISEEDLKLVKSFSATESDVGSLDGLPFNLQSQLNDGDGREDIMQRLDGVVHATPHAPRSSAARTASPRVDSNVHAFLPEPPTVQKHHGRTPSFFESLGLSYFFGGGSTEEENQQQQKDSGRGYNMNNGGDDTLALLGCAPVMHHEERERLPAMATSLIRVTSEPPPLSYAETIRATEVDPRLQDWLEGYYRIRGQPPSDGTYHLGKSRTVIVHEINRGNWTWCTAWSPTGDRLAVATENHHLAVIETTASTVWRVRHDRRISGPAKNDVTHSIRSISWGQHFIAIGGTGNAVSLLSPIEPYPIVHIIKGTGFVGTLDWKVDSDILAIGSRLEKMMIVRVKSIDRGKKVESEILHTVKFSNWVNRVAFSPGGSHLAVGDASGMVSVYNCIDEPYEPLEISLVDTFRLEDAVLDIEWAPDGRWLYAGGEDFHITVIETNYWEVVHRVKRDRWVQCIASSNGGNFLAVGGVNSEISILDVKNGWDSVMGIGLKGLVPLWAEWHPKDQALALTGQNNSVVVVETTNARHVKGHHLHSVSPILDVEFSPDGRMTVMGNEAGIVTFFSLAGSTFETAYELVVTLNDRLSISWSLNGVFVAIGAKDSLIIVGSNVPLLRMGDMPNRNPPSASGFSVRKVIRDIGETNVVSIDTQSHYVAAGGDRTRIFDSTADFRLVLEWKTGITHAIAWSPDGKLLATFGQEKNLTIYDTANKRVDRWRAIFSLNCEFVGRSLAWSPHNYNGLLYLAYGGQNNNILIMEIRTLEGTWETVLRIPRDGPINDLDWSSSGLLAAGIGNGTVTIVDLAYLQSGVPVNEKDYNWQRQALTCFTEIRRNRGMNSIRTVRWIPASPGSDSLLAMGGTDGEVEIVDLTERERCRGYVRGPA